MYGTVIQNTGSQYLVKGEDQTIYTCKIKGTFRLRSCRSTNPITIGDHVDFIQIKNETSYITDILPRRNYIIRRASNLSKQSHILAANLDMALLVATISHPQTTTTFIDRFLASAEAYRIPVIILFNKTDLYTQEELSQLQQLQDLYRSIGYQCEAVSVLKGQGLDFLTDVLKNRVTLIAGHSGVGKSALLNHFVPAAQARTAPISDYHDAGMHTTTFSTLYQLPEGGSLIDIPGIKGFGTFDFEKAEIPSYFREIFQIGQACRYSNCLHLEEPGCAVLAALEQGKIAPSRYQSYLSLLDDKEESKYREKY